METFWFRIGFGEILVTFWRHIGNRIVFGDILDSFWTHFGNCGDDNWTLQGVRKTTCFLI